MNEEPSTEYTPPVFQPAPKKSRKGLKVFGMIVLILVLMAAAAAGIYMWKQSELTAQKKDFDAKLATAQAEKAAETKTPATDSRPAHELTPPKVATATTCNADELTLTLTNGDGGGAGTLNQMLVLTNSGTRTCTLEGFPGVSLVNANGNQIGSPADRAKNYVEKSLTLKAKEAAKATVSYSVEGNFPAGTCKAGATKLRVYPPNDTGYLSIASPTITSWCPGFEVSPVQ
jgi:hypothetical protein